MISLFKRPCEKERYLSLGLFHCADIILRGAQQESWNQCRICKSDIHFVILYKRGAQMEEKIDRLVLLVEQMQGDISEMKEDISDLKEDVSGMKRDISVLQQDQAEMKQDISTLKQGQIEMKEDISGLKDDVSHLKQDVSDLKQDVSGLKQGQAEMKQNMACVLEAVNILQRQEQKHYEELSRRNRELEQLTYMNTLDIAKLRAAR